LSAFILSKVAEQNESKPLEKWARRCHFGKADESPRIHWHSPLQADLAFLELNAATLGVSAQIQFKSIISGTTPKSQLRGLPSIETQQWIEFSLTLPDFFETISSYQWSLIIHRHGDGEAPNHIGGEIIASEIHFAPPTSTRTSLSTQLRPSNPPRQADYKAESLKISKTEHENLNNHTNIVLKGNIELTPETGKHNIISASIFVAYWPDRHLPSSYAEVIVQVDNL